MIACGNDYTVSTDNILSYDITDVGKQSSLVSLVTSYIGMYSIQTAIATPQVQEGTAVSPSTPHNGWDN